MTYKQWQDWKALVEACRNPNTGSIQAHGKKRREAILKVDELMGTLMDGMDVMELLETKSTGSVEKRKYNRRRWSEKRRANDSVLAWGEAE